MTRAQARRERRKLAALVGALGVVALVLGVLAFTTWREAQDTRAATRPLVARATRLHGDLRDADTVIDRLTWVSAALRSQDDATQAAVLAANQAATQYNNAQAGIAAAVGSSSGSTATTLQETTTDVRGTCDEAASAVTQLNSEAAADGDG